MAQQQPPATPTGLASAGHSIFGGPDQSSTDITPQMSLTSFASTLTPASASSNNTFIMPNSPLKNRAPMDGYRPKVTRTLGQRPACLVNASVTYCGNNQIYAFGGFDQYTDEVYNHVLRLDLVSHQWTLVDNYGDIPGVRMGRVLLAAQPPYAILALDSANCFLPSQVIRLRCTKATNFWYSAARTNTEPTFPI